MVKKNKNVAKSIVAIAGASLVAAAGIFGAISYDNIQDELSDVRETLSVSQQNITQLKDVINNKESKIVSLENQDPKVVTKYVNNTVEVPVPNGDMSFTLNRLEDKMIIDDADNIVSELKAEDNALDKAFSYVLDNRDDLFDLLEDNSIVQDENDVDIKKIYNDFEDVNVVNSDFDNDAYEFVLKFKVEDLESEDKLYTNVTVVVEDGEPVIDDAVIA